MWQAASAPYYIAAGGVGEADKALKTKGIVQGGARPTVGKHGMDRHEDPAPTRGQPRLLDQVRGVSRRLHYSIRTEQTYVDWIRRFILYLIKAGLLPVRFILFHRKRHPADMGAPEVEAFLTHLAVQGKVAASTQNQALNAIVFLYRQVLKKELGWLDGLERAKKPVRLPVVFTREEARAVLARLDGIRWVMASLLYGFGLRLMECTGLRVKDVDFHQHQLIVRNGKGSKDRITLLPDRLVEPLKTHLDKVSVLHKKDLSEGFGAVYLPFALEKKYPNANREWGWQYVFPATHRSVDPRSGIERRHHIDPTVLQRAVKDAVRSAAS